MASAALLDFMVAVSAAQSHDALVLALQAFARAAGARTCDVELSARDDDRPAGATPPDGQDDPLLWQVPLTGASCVPGRVSLRFASPPDAATRTELQAALGLTARLLTQTRTLVDLQAANNAAHYLLGIAAHDLRAPLGVIESSARILAHPDVSVDARAASIGWLTGQIAVATELISSLLDYTALELDGRRQIRPTRCDLVPHLRSTVTALTLDEPGQRVTLALPAALHCTVDVARIRQVLTNLLTNALNHGEPGQPIAIRAIDDDGRLRLTVENDASPIALDRLARLFEPFETSRPDGGSRAGPGLGLFIVRRIVEAHRGRVSCRPVGDRRLVFVVELPLDGPGDPAPDVRPARTAPP